MQPKTLLLSFLAAAILAACGGGKEAALPATAEPRPLPTATAVQSPKATATPTMHAVFSGVTLDGACLESGKSPDALFYLTAKSGGSIPEKAFSFFSVASVVEKIFPYYQNPANKANFICDGVAILGDYAVVIGRDGKASNKPYSVAYVFKAGLFEQSYGSFAPGIGIVNVIPNVGHQKGNRLAIGYALDKDSHDVLIMHSLVNGGSEANIQMLNANAAALGHSRFNYGAKLSVFQLGKPVRYDQNTPISISIAPEIAARPVAFGVDVQLETLVMSGRNGQGFLAITASEDFGGRRTFEAGIVPLKGDNGFLNGGIQPDKPLLANPRLTK